MSFNFGHLYNYGGNLISVFLSNDSMYAWRPKRDRPSARLSVRLTHG